MKIGAPCIGIYFNFKLYVIESVPLINEREFRLSDLSKSFAGRDKHGNDYNFLLISSLTLPF